MVWQWECVVIMKIQVSGSLEDNLVAQALQATDSPAGDGLPVPFLKILVSQVPKGLPGLDSGLARAGVPC
jgi:hypothetical protein